MNHQTCALTILIAITAMTAETGCSRMASRDRSHNDLKLGKQRPSLDVYNRQVDTSNPRISELPTKNSTITPVMNSDSRAASKLPGDGEIGPAVSATSDPVQSTHEILGPTPDGPSQSIRQAVMDARAVLDRLQIYQVRLNRQERIDGLLLDPEVLTMSIRREPRAVRLTWTDGPHRGREVMFRADEIPQVMHVNMADSKFPLPRMKLPIDSPMVTKNSRHPISEAGFETIVESLEKCTSDQGSATLNDLGDSPTVIPGLVARGIRRTMANGDRWTVYLSTESKLPVMVECMDKDGNLLERNQFSDFKADPVELGSSEAFNPELRWAGSRTLFGRALK